MIRAAIHRLLGGRLIDLDTPRLVDLDGDSGVSSDPKSDMRDELKDPIRTLVRRFLKQFLSDGSPLLTMAHNPSGNMISANELVQVPADWRPKFKWGIKKLPNGDYDWTSTPITYGDHTPDSTDAPPPPLPLGPEFPDKKWCIVELMPPPDSIFAFIWEYLYWHMRTARSGIDEGILMVRHDGRNIFLRVARHCGSLIIIQRQLT